MPSTRHRPAPVAPSSPSTSPPYRMPCWRPSSSALPPAPTPVQTASRATANSGWPTRSEEHTSELQSQSNLVCRLLLEKKTPTHDKLAGAPPELPRPTYHLHPHHPLHEGH